MLIKTTDWSRRAFLGSLACGGAMAGFLPIFSGASRAAGEAPTRLLVFHHGHGMAYFDWKPSGTEDDWSLSPVLQPLAAYKDKLIVLGGVNHDVASMGENKHVDGFKSILTGTARTPEAKTAAISIDQLIANELAAQTNKSSLLVGVLTDHRGVSATGPLEELSAEKNPAEVFHSLFDGLDLSEDELQKLKADRRSVIDVVDQNLVSIQDRVAAEDRAKIGKHLDAIRSIENDLDNLGQVGAACTIPPEPQADGFNDPNNYEAVGKLQLDLIANAFACDLTRVAVINWGGGQMQPNFVGLTESMHDLAHQGSGPGKPLAAKFTTLTTWYATQLAYFMEVLDSYPEGDGSLLDNTLIVWLPFVKSGHFWDDMPITLAGGAGGQLDTGRFVTYDSPRQTNDLWTLVANLMGVEIDGFGDPDFSSGPLPGLTV